MADLMILPPPCPPYTAGAAADRKCAKTGPLLSSLLSATRPRCPLPPGMLATFVGSSQ